MIKIRMNRMRNSSFVVISLVTAFGIMGVQGVQAGPTIFDNLILPESGDGELFSIALEYQNDSLIDLTLQYAADSRFAIDTSAREQLWRLLARSTGPTGSRSVWRQDQLDEMLVGINNATSTVRAEIYDQLTFAEPQYVDQAKAALLTALYGDDDIVSLIAALKSMNKYRDILTPQDRDLILSMVLDMGSVSADLEQSVLHYQEIFWHSEMDTYSYRFAVECAVLILQSGTSVADALIKISPLEAGNKSAIASAMLRLIQTEGSVFESANSQDRAVWMSAFKNYLADSSSAPLVLCCIADSAVLMYQIQDIDKAVVTDLLVTVVDAHYVPIETRNIVIERIVHFDGVEAVPVPWGE